MVVYPNSEDDELEDVQGSNVVKVDETEEESALVPETGTAGESSQPEVVLAMPTSKDRSANFSSMTLGLIKVYRGSKFL